MSSHFLTYIRFFAETEAKNRNALLEKTRQISLDFIVELDSQHSDHVLFFSSNQGEHCTGLSLRISKTMLRRPRADAPNELIDIVQRAGQCDLLDGGLGRDGHSFSPLLLK